MSDKKPFESLDEVEDVRIIIKANGKHYSIVPKNNVVDAKNDRLAMLSVLLDTHFVLDTALEDIEDEL